MIQRALIPHRFDVALRKESVDRNPGSIGADGKLHRSLSARRAWIEIISHQPNGSGVVVALRKESVDRNLLADFVHIHTFASLSARRAWIEILVVNTMPPIMPSLSARRAWIEIIRKFKRYSR